jgi:hypothetical protein
MRRAVLEEEDVDDIEQLHHAFVSSCIMRSSRCGTHFTSKAVYQYSSLPVQLVHDIEHLHHAFVQVQILAALE